MNSLLSLFIISSLNLRLNNYVAPRPPCNRRPTAVNTQGACVLYKIVHVDYFGPRLQVKRL